MNIFSEATGFSQCEPEPFIRTSYAKRISARVVPIKGGWQVHNLKLSDQSKWVKTVLHRVYPTEALAECRAREILALEN